MELPCGHAYCGACLAELRSKGVGQACPLCRAPLPPGREKLYELASQVWVRFRRVYGNGATAWPPLSASQQEEMDGAIVMFQEAMDQVSGHVRDAMVPCGARAHRASPPPLQGHILAACAIGDIYGWGKGVAIDYPRAMAAYKIAAEAGDAVSQSQVGFMYYNGDGVAVDYKQALPWIEKAAAQDDPDAVGLLGNMYFDGESGVTPSWRRARELYQRAIEKGKDGTELFHQAPRFENEECEDSRVRTIEPFEVELAQMFYREVIGCEGESAGCSEHEAAKRGQG